MAAGNDIAIQNTARDRLGAAPACLWGGGLGDGVADGVGSAPVTKDCFESQGSAYSVGGLRGLPQSAVDDARTGGAVHRAGAERSRCSWRFQGTCKPDQRPAPGRAGKSGEGGGGRARSFPTCWAAAPQSTNLFPPHRAAKGRPKE